MWLRKTRATVEVVVLWECGCGSMVAHGGYRGARLRWKRFNGATAWAFIGEGIVRQGESMVV